MKNNRSAFIIAAVVAAGVAAFFATRGHYPPKSSTEGAIGAANRYTSQQIADQDVALKDPQVQAFLQSDTFHKLTTDAAFRESLRDQAVAEALRAPGFTEALKNNTDAAVLKGDGLRGVLTEAAKAQVPADAIRGALTADAARVLTSGQMRVLLDDATFRAELARGGNLESALRGEALKSYEAMTQKYATEWGACKTNTDFVKAITNDNSRTIIEGSAYRALADQLSKTSPDFARSISEAAVQRAVTDGAVAKIADNAVVMDALRTAGGDQAFQKIDWGKYVVAGN